MLCEEAEIFGMEVQCYNWHPWVQKSSTWAMCT